MHRRCGSVHVLGSSTVSRDDIGRHAHGGGTPTRPAGLTWRPHAGACGGAAGHHERRRQQRWGLVSRPPGRHRGLGAVRHRNGREADHARQGAAGCTTLSRTVEDVAGGGLRHNANGASASGQGDEAAGGAKARAIFLAVWSDSTSGSRPTATRLETCTADARPCEPTAGASVVEQMTKGGRLSARLQQRDFPSGYCGQGGERRAWEMRTPC